MSLVSGASVDTYEIVAPLGAGGMGEVWLATDHRLQRKVAIKILPTASTEQAARVVRFQREARAASALNHPNVCAIYALGETPDGHQFIVMELVEGAWHLDDLRDTERGRRSQPLDGVDHYQRVGRQAAMVARRQIDLLRPDSFLNVWAVQFDGAAGTAVGEPFQVTRYDSPKHQLSPRFETAEIGVSAHRLMLTIMEQTGNIWTLHMNP